MVKMNSSLDLRLITLSWPMLFMMENSILSIWPGLEQEIIRFNEFAPSLRSQSPNYNLASIQFCL